MSREQAIRDARRAKLDTLLSLGVSPFGSRFDRTHTCREILESHKAATQVQLAEAAATARVAGRVVSKREMGGSGFFHVQDFTERLQAYIRKDLVSALDFEIFELLDLGDFVGLEGPIIRTKSGELSLKVTKLTFLTKSLAPLPDKFHGLTDQDARYRQRYVDLIVNPSSRDVFRRRSIITRTMRAYLDQRGFYEVETPAMHQTTGGATARPFATHHNALDLDLYLRIATELHLKRLIVGGFERVYEIGRIFRNEGISTRHNPEFTSLELYQAYGDLSDIVELTRDIIKACCLAINETLQISYQGEMINLDGAWRTVTMAELVNQVTGLDFHALPDDQAARQAVKLHGDIEVKDSDSWGTLLVKMFEERVEQRLIQPTFVTMHPLETSPLAKRSSTEPRLTERFELYITGREIANAFSELNDPVDQRERFLVQAAQRLTGNAEAMQMDEDFLYALEIGMPPTGGLGIGIDRLVMLLTDAQSIRDVILFPTMRPRED